MDATASKAVPFLVAVPPPPCPITTLLHHPASIPPLAVLAGVQSPQEHGVGCLLLAAAHSSMLPFATARKRLPVAYSANRIGLLVGF